MAAAAESRDLAGTESVVDVGAQFVLAGQHRTRAFVAWFGEAVARPWLRVTDSGQVDVFECGVQAGRDRAAGQPRLDKGPKLFWVDVVGVRTWRQDMLIPAFLELR